MSKSYLSEKLKKPEPVNRKDGITEVINPYFADADLQKAVNLAILLNRPLLLMGEPGCGKSVIAKAIAFEWYQSELYIKNKYFEWNVKSTSKAREGLYDFDHLLRLRDSNYKTEGIDITDYDRYRRFGPLAEAMKNSDTENKAVLLIDEIDKADIDFSNDLLNELDRNSFYIPETGETVTYQYKPLIIITSNGEKDLSDAFLRRCIFHYIDLFSLVKLKSKDTRDRLRDIILARFYETKEQQDEALVEKAISTFLVLRANMNAETSSYRKAINTSEFLDWFEVLRRSTSDNAFGLNEDVQLLAWKDSKQAGKVPVPFGNVLFKTPAALLNFKEVELPS